MSNIIEKAQQTAICLHANQKRKGSNIPYIIHPTAVAEILSRYTDDQDIICAGWLHDTLEDVVGYDYEKLERDFGQQVAKIVKEVSEDKDPSDSRAKSIATWKKRKGDYIKNLRNNSQEALMVSCADKIANLQELTNLFTKLGEVIWENFNAPKPAAQSEIWYFGTVLKILQERLDNKMVGEYEEVLDRFKNLFQKSSQ